LYVAPRGTIDILPEDQPYWEFLRAKIAEVTALFDYRRIDVPIFEETPLYVRGVGEGTDIVDKEMYSFIDKGGRDITLRPEFTAGIVRAYVQHGMKTLPQPVKLYTLGPIFRYERVQAGRYRQHTQFDIECIGEQDPAVDLEVMSVAWQLFSRIGFQGLNFQLNSTGCPVPPELSPGAGGVLPAARDRDLCGLPAEARAQPVAPVGLQGRGVPADH
jgi:histidyl-tRNA synthetase